MFITAVFYVKNEKKKRKPGEAFDGEVQVPSSRFESLCTRLLDGTRSIYQEDAPGLGPVTYLCGERILTIKGYVRKEIAAAIEAGAAHVDLTEVQKEQ